MSILRFPALLASACLLSSVPLFAQGSMTPLPGFGANGWLAPGTPYLGTADGERGLAYNPATGNLLLVTYSNIASPGAEVRIFDGATGLGGARLNQGGVNGGALPLVMIDVTPDGAIYAANQTTNGGMGFKVYKYDSEAVGVTTPPTVVFDDSVGVAQCGDAFAVTGGTPGNPARFAAAGFNSINVGNFVVGTLDGSNTRVTFLSVPGTNTGSNDYGASLTWVDQNTLIGCAGGVARQTSFQLGSGASIVDATIPLGAAGRRVVDRAIVGGRPVLAVLNTNNSNVTVFDVTDPTMPVLLCSGNNTVGASPPNTLGTGAVAWGAISGSTATLYAMSTNQGIQAFHVDLTAAAAVTYGVGCAGLDLDAMGPPPTIGNTAFALELSVGASPAAFLAFGTSAVDPGFDLASIGMPSCFAYTSFDIGMFASGPVLGGFSIFQLPIPADPQLVGGQMAAQGAALTTATPLGLGASNGLLLTFGY